MHYYDFKKKKKNASTEQPGSKTPSESELKVSVFIFTVTSWILLKSLFFSLIYKKHFFYFTKSTTMV